MIDLLELADKEKFRQKISGYENHKANNVNLINKIIKQNKK